MTDITSVMKQVVESSSQLTTWALLVGGGSVAAIVSTSYRRPLLLKFRMPYLLFIPGWCALGYSLYSGDLIMRMHLAMHMVSTTVASKIPQDINNAYRDQQIFLFVALGFFATWLLLYLLNWVFSNSLSDGEKK